MDNTHVEERNGGYYIRGKRISLDSIVYLFRDGVSPEDIQQNFHGLTLADVYGAISFYLDHREEVDAYLVRQRQLWEELERTGIPPNPDLLARMEAAKEKQKRAAVRD